MTNFKFDFTTNKIVGSKNAIAKASSFGTPEYRELAKMMKAQPTFGVAEKPIQKHKKTTYKGLTSNVMFAFVEKQKNEAKMKEYEAVKALGYPSLKKWFLENYKGSFTMADLKENHSKVKIYRAINKEEVAAKETATATTPIKNELADAAD